MPGGDAAWLATAFGGLPEPGPGPEHRASSPPAPRLNLIADRDPRAAALVRCLLPLGTSYLARAHAGGEFAFTLAGERGPAGGFRLLARGASLRYSAICLLGLMRLGEARSRAALGGDSCDDVLGRLAKRLDQTACIGDVALICWAAAESGHSELQHALDRLWQLDRRGGQIGVVSAAWALTALVAARRLADVERHLELCRDRLLAARRAVFGHLIGGRPPWYRSHVGSFADQVYPVQALARLHASSGDPAALAAADEVAAALCLAQGDAGQWWWHYDSRTGAVVERYPAYSVHQHAMAPMALLDLAEAGGEDHAGAICRGLRWLARRPETREHLIREHPPVVWRKVARRDRWKVVRGASAAVTRIHPAARLPGVDLLLRPGAVDYECRPYELGWLLYAWLPGAPARAEDRRW